MHLFHIPQCSNRNRNLHISVLNGALWDIEQVHIGICKLGQFMHMIRSLMMVDFNHICQGYLCTMFELVPVKQSWGKWISWWDESTRNSWYDHNSPRHNETVCVYERACHTLLDWFTMTIYFNEIIRSNILICRCCAQLCVSGVGSNHFAWYNSIAQTMQGNITHVISNHIAEQPQR